MNALSMGISPEHLPLAPSSVTSRTEPMSSTTSSLASSTAPASGAPVSDLPASAVLPGPPSYAPPQAPPPVVGGVPPWARAGAGHAAPEDDAAVAAAGRWQQRNAQMQAADNSRREERRRVARNRAQEANNKRLEDHARRMFYVGFAALPFVWIMSLVYFWKEIRSPEANPSIKKHVRMSGVMLIVYTAIFLTWFIVFQVLHKRLNVLSILNVSNFV